MKYNKIISITLFNAFVLLIFASLLSSCQKSKIKTVGLYTDMAKDIGRMPASVKSDLDFDPKQIYIYCNINSVNSKQCYKQNFKQFLNESKNKTIAKKVNDLIAQHSYENSEKLVNEITERILNQIDSKITYFTNKRTSFCKKNARVNHRKCLETSVDADTMNILNGYQQSVKLINGQEYLYLKLKIKNQLENSIQTEYKHYKTNI